MWLKTFFILLLLQFQPNSLDTWHKYQSGIIEVDDKKLSLVCFPHCRVVTMTGFGGIFVTFSASSRE